MRKPILGLAVAVFLALGVPIASASSITFTVGGLLVSTSVDSGDAVFANAAILDNYSLVLTYDPAAFDTTASLVFTDTTQGESQTLANAGNYFFLNSPGSYGPGTTWLGFVDGSNDYVNMYFNGSVTGPGDVSGLNALTADNNASPAPFEWLFNFPDGGQTDLQGVITSVSAVASNPAAVPEPATLWLLAPGLLLFAFYERRRRRAETRA